VRELPQFLQETAFLDRLKGLIPGWELPKLTANSFASSVGLKSDFFGDVLIALRNDLTADQYCAQHVQLDGYRVYKRNQEWVQNLSSGLMKILFPDGQFTTTEFHRNCVKPALKLRQLVWDQLYTLDEEYRQFSRQLTCGEG
jgi:ATP-dependent Lon protease